MVELKSHQHIVDTQLHLTSHPKRISNLEGFWLEERRKRERGSEGIPNQNEPHKLCGSMNAWQECVRNHTNCLDLWNLGKDVWNQELGQKECAFPIMWWYLCTPGSPKYIQSITESSLWSLYLRMYIYREAWIIHNIVWCRESCDCYNDEYDTANVLWLWNHKNHSW